MEVTELQCEILPYTECSMTMESATYKSHEMVPKTIKKKIYRKNLLNKTYEKNRRITYLDILKESHGNELTLMRCFCMTHQHAYNHDLSTYAYFPHLVCSYWAFCILFRPYQPLLINYFCLLC